MAFKKITELTAATGVELTDLLLIVDVLANQTKKLSFAILRDALAGATTSDLVSNESGVSGATVTDALNALLAGAGAPGLDDLLGRFTEGSNYTIHKDVEGLVDYVETNLGAGLTKRWTYTRNPDGFVDSLNIHKSDSSYDKTYAFSRDAEGFVSAISIT